MTDKTQELADRFFAVVNEYATENSYNIERLLDNHIIVTPNDNLSIISSSKLLDLISEFTLCWVDREGLVLGD